MIEDCITKQTKIFEIQVDKLIEFNETDIKRGIYLPRQRRKQLHRYGYHYRGSLLFAVFGVLYASLLEHGFGVHKP